MASRKAKPSTLDKEINSVINRLHSGSRFINYTDSKRNKPTDEDHTQNALRNLSHPDEVHVELGRALALAYVRSLHSIIHVLYENGNNEVQAASERGMHIMQSLVSGEDISRDDDDKGGVNGPANYHKANYAAAGSSFFDCLIEMVFTKHDTDYDDTTDQQMLRSFIGTQWQQWCIECEELAYANDNARSFSGGGGYHVMNACLKGYASIFFPSLPDSSGEVYRSLKHSPSRKFWIRICVYKAAEMVKSVALEPINLLVESKSSDGVEVLSSKGTEADKLLVTSLSPLFHACILQARHTSDQKSETTNTVHIERQLQLREILRACSALLREGNNNDDYIVHQIAWMVQYLTNSLRSYVRQIVTGFFFEGQSDVIEFTYDWLCGICDVIGLIMSSFPEESNTTIDLLTASCETILRYLLPQITPAIGFSLISFDVTPVYLALEQIVPSLPKHKLEEIADANLAMNLGTLALNSHNDEEVDILCNLISSVFGAVSYGLARGSGMLWTGGILCSLGCVFQPRHSLKNIVKLKELGETMLRKSQTTSYRGDGIVKDLIPNEDCHLIDMLSQSFDNGLNSGSDYLVLINALSSSLVNVGGDLMVLHKWKRRPLSLMEQHAALLVGLSQLHVTFSFSVSGKEAFQIDDPFTLVRPLLKCHPRISARVVPSVVSMIKACVSETRSPSQSLLKAFKFLSSSAIVSDPHAASIVWGLFSSLTNESNPPSVRSSTLRILPDLCANKKLRSRIRAIIGKSLTSKDPIIRTAAMASLCDMTELDLIRDVEEIVGWIQAGLNDEEVSVSYFALASLKHLISNEELDFDLVMKVLAKRLALDIDDVNNILTVMGNGLVMEGFILILAQAGYEEVEEDDDNENTEGGPCVSFLSVKSVSLLIDLALSTELSRNIRMQTSILKSLASLPAQLLGLDADAIRLWNANTSDEEVIAAKRRYEDVKHIALTGLEFVVNQPTSVDELVDSITSIMATLLQFEEEVHGSALYRGSSSEKTFEQGNENISGVPKAVLSCLPDFEDCLQMYDDEPTASTATAVVCSITGSNLSAQAMLSQLSNLFFDFARESLSEPLLQAIQITALMNCVSTLRQSIEKETEQQELYVMVMNEIQGWANTSGDLAYVALAIFSIDGGAMQPGLADKAISIQNKILEGFDTLMFDNTGMKMLSLCFVASKLSNTADARVTDVIDRLDGMVKQEKMSSGDSFGVMFGMSVLLNRLSQDGNSSETWRVIHSRRIISMYLFSLNSCLTVSNATILTLATCVVEEMNLSSLKEACEELEEQFVKDRSLTTLKSILLGFGKCFSTLDADLLLCILSIVQKLPWKSGKALALSAAYKSCLGLGVRDQNDLSNEIRTITSHISDNPDDPNLGHMIYGMAELSQLRSRAENIVPEIDLVKSTIKSVMDPGRDFSGDQKQMAVFASLFLVGELGVSSLSNGVHSYIKKSLVKSTTQFLKVVASNDAEDSKTKDAAIIALGAMSGMKASALEVKKSHDRSKNDCAVNFSDILQGKEDTIMLSILIRINSSHATITSTAYGDRTRAIASQKLTILFKSLRAVSLPGNVSRVIDATLNDSNKAEINLKSSCVEILTSQLETRRRVGFDGRGFIDLYIRLLKMSPESIEKLAGTENMPALMAAVANTIPLLPTSSAEGTLNNLWAVCQCNLTDSFNAQSGIEFFVGLKSLLVMAKTSAKKNVVSPAVLKCIQKLVTSNFFQDMCQYAGPSVKDFESTADAEKLWLAYAECIHEVSDCSAISECDVNSDNLFGIATCSSVLSQPSKVSRKVEVFISKHEWLGGIGLELESVSLRLLLTSLMAVGQQCSTVSEMKVSTLSLLDLMLVKGIDTMCLEVLSVMVSFWWDSLKTKQIDLETPLLQISTCSSLLLTQDLCFKMQAWSLDMIIKLFRACIADLPPKLAFLCSAWKISDDVSNRASRVLKDALGTKRADVRRKHALACLTSVVHLLNGGEP